MYRETPPPILVLDDDPDVLGLVQRTLSEAGWRVVTATDAPSALALCEQEHPCLLLVDLMLPHMDGEAFVEEIRRRSPHPPPAVVLLTASEARQQVAERLGVPSLPKPFELEDVCAVAREHGA